MSPKPDDNPEGIARAAHDLASLGLAIGNLAALLKQANDQFLDAGFTRNEARELTNTMLAEIVRGGQRGGGQNR